MLFPTLQRSRATPRIVITGAGIVTALGLTWKSNVEGFRLGQRAFRPVTFFDVSRQRVKTAGEVQLPDTLPQTRLSRNQTRRLDRAGKLLLLAADQAWQQARWNPSSELPTILGTTSGGMSLGEAYYRQAIQRPERRRHQPSRVIHYQAQRQALDLAEAFGLRGPAFIIANACASGANALGHAWHWLRSGHADRVLAGGYDALSQLVFSGFDSLQALSPTQCRPFDADRDGLALGEGAAVFALENLDYAGQRKATILGEIVGYGACTDAYHLTQPDPAGNAAFVSMSAACSSAGLDPDQIGYVNAHGTGTPLNDVAEAAAINLWAGSRAATLPVSSIKSSVGHLLGAAGAVEAAVCLMALQEQWLPPTPTVKRPDPIAAFPIVRRPTIACFEYAMTNSFGFGGANATLILRQWK